VLLVVAQHLRHYQHFILEAFGEQRTDGSVDQARDQGLAFGRGALALEIAARNLAGGVIAFLIVDGQGKEVLAFLVGLGANGCGQPDGFTIGGERRASSLARDLAGLKGPRAAAPFEAFFVNIEHVIFFRHRPQPDRWRAFLFWLRHETLWAVVTSGSPYGTSS